MKKYIVILVLCFHCVVSYSQFAKKATNKRWEIGLLGNYMHFDGITRGGAGLNVTIFGFYLDFMGMGASHRNDVRVDTWKENTSFAIHAGYQIPIIKAIRIIPVIGYATAGVTTTDGSNWTTTSSGIVNHQSTKASCKAFDYGSVLCINIKHINIYGAFTAHNIYGGLGLEF